MFDFKLVLELKDNLIQILQEKTRIFHTVWVLYEYELECFEVQFRNLEYKQFISCRSFE